MVDDACGSGASRSTSSRLLRSDDEVLDAASRTRSRSAEEIARARGHRPAAARDRRRARERRCEFVEDGGAFVSWERRRAPLLFPVAPLQLPRGRGWSKHVKPQVLRQPRAEQDVLAIWNGAEWRAFRGGRPAVRFPVLLRLQPRALRLREGRGVHAGLPPHHGPVLGLPLVHGRVPVPRVISRGFFDRDAQARVTARPGAASAAASAPQSIRCRRPRSVPASRWARAPRAAR